MKYYAIQWYGPRHWAVYMGDRLICVTVYKKGAVAVVEEFLTLHGWSREKARAHIKSCLDTHARERREDLRKDRAAVRKSEMISIPKGV